MTNLEYMVLCSFERLMNARNASIEEQEDAQAEWDIIMDLYESETVPLLSVLLSHVSQMLRDASYSDDPAVYTHSISI